MAMVTRRYRFVGPSSEDLLRILGASANRTADFPLSIIDVSIDDSVDGAPESLDQYMASRGWLYSPLSAPAVVVASSKFGYALVTPIVEVATWQLVDGVVTSPDFFNADLNVIFGRVVGQFRTDAAGAELRVVEAKAGAADVVMGSIVAPSTVGVWTTFGFSTTVPPRTGQNTYTLEARTNGVAVCELRYLTLSLIRSLQA